MAGTTSRAAAGARPHHARDGAVVSARRALLRLALAIAIACLSVATLTLGTAAGASARLLSQAPGPALAPAETQKAPVVSKQPLPKTVEEGQSATFESTATGVPTPTVQWERSTDGGSTWSEVSGATSNQLTIAAAVVAESGYQFRAKFENAAGKATSKAVTLTVHKAPQVTLQPKETTVLEGQNATFEAAASGSPAPTVKWEFSSDGGATWSAAPGGTTDKLTVTGTKTTFDGRLYRATFKNVAGEAPTEPATLHVHKVPAVTKQPVATTVEEGSTATFEATASGFPPPTVQWERSTDGGSTWSAVEGATSAQLTVPATTTAENGYEFRAKFNNVAGEATSNPAVLTVQKAPTVTQEPKAVTVEEGQPASFEAAGSGFPTPTVQWELSTNGGVSWSAVSGAISDTLTIASTKTSESGHEYRAMFTNAAGKASSAAATLTVQKRPAVTKQPLNTTVIEGESAIFEATASGFPSPTVQWQSSNDGGITWSEISGATSDRLTVPSTTVAESGTEYQAVFTNAAGKATSAAATLTVHAPPVLTQQPSSTTVEVGTEASFEATASGSPPPTVQWEVSSNGGTSWSAVPGATSDQLTIAATKTSENGEEFRAAFTNSAGKATSSAAILTVATTHYNAVAWGSNVQRQLGTGSFEALSDVPIPVDSLKFVTSVAAGGNHSLALFANETVEEWGTVEPTEEGESIVHPVPVPVSGLKQVKAIAAGGNHSLALLSNGTVVAWGRNKSGQLGDGNLLPSETPVPVKSLTGVKAIAAGGEHSLALLSNGTVMAWGNNEAGQLGNGKLANSDVPVAVKNLTGVTSVSAGEEFSLALSKGAVEAWGANESLQLGNASVEEPFSDVPVQVGSLSGVSAIAAGAQHGLALVGGTVMAWGEDKDGELGNGTIQAAEGTPVAVSGLSGVSAISAGGQDSVALLGNGSLQAWGINQRGTLGNGTTGSPSDVPVAVSGVAKVASVSAGGSHMLAFGEPTPIVTGLSPSLGAATGGTPVTISGHNFEGATAVKFGATAATSFSVTSATTIEAVAPAGTGTVDVTVTSPNGTSPPVTGDRFTYAKAPTILRLSAKSGPTEGKTPVTITGTEFTGATKVTFGGVSALFKVTSSTSIEATSPPGSVGAVEIQVTTPGGTSATSTKDRFSYTPTVEAVAPNGGPVAGKTSVTVTGTGFALGSTATTFRFGLAKATEVNCTSSTSCTMTSPAGSAGTVNVVATVNKVKSPVNPGDGYTYS